jgi:hypothetical protein
MDLAEQEAKIEIADCVGRLQRIGNEEEAKAPQQSVVSYNKITRHRPR